MQSELVVALLFISNVMIYWLIPAISLTKILSEIPELESYKLWAWVPVLNSIAVAKIVGENFWKLFGIMILLSSAVRIIGIAWEDNLRFFPSTEDIVIYIVVMSFLEAIAVFYLWHKVAKRGGFKNYLWLGYLAGLPIVVLFIMPKIAWQGKWNHE